MTTQREELDSAPNELDLGGIEDTTSEDQIAAEAELVQGNQPQLDDTPDVDTTEPTGEAQDVPQGEAPITEQAPVPVETPEQPQRTYTEDEWRKAQSSWQRQIDQQRNERLELERRFAEAQQQQQVLSIGQQVEQASQALENHLAGELGADEARRRVRDPNVQQQLKQRFENENQLQTLKQQNEQFQRQQLMQQVHAEQQQLASGMGEWLKKLRTDFRLDDNSMRAIIDSIPETAYQSLDAYERAGTNAQRLAQRLGQNRVPPETAKTRLESGISTGDGAMNDDQRSRAIQEKPSWEWTEDEIKFLSRR